MLMGGYIEGFLLIVKELKRPNWVLYVLVQHKGEILSLLILLSVVNN